MRELADDDCEVGVKTKAGYSHLPVSADDLKRADRAAEALVERARRINVG